jgi:hypothetical protein
MLQAINAVHTFSVVNHTLYFGALLLLTCFVCPGWYKLVRLQLASVSTSPHAPIQPRTVFVRRDNAILIVLAHVRILGKIESHRDIIASTLPIKVT